MDRVLQIGFHCNACDNRFPELKLTTGFEPEIHVDCCCVPYGETRQLDPKETASLVPYLFREFYRVTDMLTEDGIIDPDYVPFEEVSTHG